MPKAKLELATPIKFGKNRSSDNLSGDNTPALKSVSKITPKTIAKKAKTTHKKLTRSLTMPMPIARTITKIAPNSPLKLNK